MINLWHFFISHTLSNHPVYNCRGPDGTNSTVPSQPLWDLTLPCSGPYCSLPGPSVPTPVMVQQCWSPAPFCFHCLLVLPGVPSVLWPRFFTCCAGVCQWTLLPASWDVPCGWGHSQCWVILRSGSTTAARATPSHNYKIHKGDLICAFPELIPSIRKYTKLIKQFH